MNDNLTDSTGAKPSIPVWFWVVSILGLLWYLMDTSMFFMRLSLTEDAINAMPENQQPMFRNTPTWVTAVFACEVFGGLIGAIALLLRKRWALPLFIISILGIVAQTCNIWFLTDSIALMGAPAIIMPIVGFVIAAGLIAFSRFATSKGWLV